MGLHPSTFINQFKFLPKFNVAINLEMLSFLSLILHLIYSLLYKIDEHTIYILVGYMLFMLMCLDLLVLYTNCIDV